jgi:hypothetical protein
LARAATSRDRRVDMRSIKSEVFRTSSWRRSAFASSTLLLSVLSAGARLATGGASAGSTHAAQCGPPASDLPWWTPIAVSLVLLFLGLAYILVHRRRAAPPEAPAVPAEDTAQAAGPPARAAGPGPAPGPEEPRPPRAEPPAALDLAPVRVYP